MDEHVLAFPSSLLDHLGQFQGISMNPDAYLPEILNPEHCVFLERSAAEQDLKYKQIIPYVILSYDGQVVSYLRGSLLREERLLGRYSLGFGGHISTKDPRLFGMLDAYMSGMEREVEEELQIIGSHEDHIVAVINDDSDEVGRVHFGIVHVWKLDRFDVKAREKSIREVSLKSVEELHRDKEKYENWSQLCIDVADILL